MQLWATERGTLWALETMSGLPLPCQARVETEFQALESEDIPALAAAMNGAAPDSLMRRLQTDRRCFCLKVAEQIVSYGWVTNGVECVGELERQFQLDEDEAYIWECGTVPAWRRQRCYSALLSQLIHQLHGEGAHRIWIGSSRRNQASIRAFANAGFQPVLDLIYRRFYRLTFMRIMPEPAAPPQLTSAADRILISPQERRIGPWIIGFKR